LKNIAWKMNRLRAMSAREIVHRGLQWPLQRLEKWAVSAAWSPHPPISVEPKLALFPDVEGWEAAWQSLYRIDRDGLATILGGKIDFFGHQPVNVGAPVDWHRDPVTGIRPPLKFGKAINYRDDTVVGDVKYIWELGRHQHLVPLAVAYACTGEVQYRNAVVSQIDRWIETNPYGMGIHWCSSLELALRLISWSVVHGLLALRDGEAGLFAAVTDRNAFGRAVYQQAWFVRHYLSRHSSANNHLIGELTGLWVACQVFDLGDIGAHWAEFAQRELEQQAKLQVHDDGVDKEQAVYYHLWVLEYLLFAWLTGERCGTPFTNGFRERVVTMATFLNDITPPGGRPPQIGDADDGFVTRFEAAWPQNPYQDVLAAVKHALGAGQLLACGSPLPQKAYWYGMILGKSPESDAENKTSPNDRSYPVIYREGGYAMLGDKRMHLVFDAGPLGYPSIAAHAHADALSFCLAVRGEWWLVDPGTYSYHSETRWRDYFRGTISHSTLRVDKTNQSEIGGAFLWRRHAVARIEKYGTDPDGRQWVEGSHDGFSRIGVIHHRRIDFYPQEEKILIADRIEGNGVHDFDVCFHFAPDVFVAPGPHHETWTAAMPGKPGRLEFHVDASWQWDIQRGSEEPLLGWYSPALGSKVPACTLRGRWQGRAPVSVVTSIALKN
jgi:hypothetical protein